MADISLLDFPVAASFVNNDALIVNKSENTCNQVTYSTVREGLKIPASIPLLVAAGGDANTFNLSPLNDSNFTEYKDGTVIGFILPATVEKNKITKVNINSLGEAEIKNVGDGSPIVGDEGDYVMAYCKDKKFYRFNFAQSQLQSSSSEYTITKQEVIGGNTTKIDLKSASGAAKIYYYEGMIVMFTGKEDTKGSIQMSIDGLPYTAVVNDVVINSGTKIQKGEQIIATYNKASNVFIKKSASSEQIVIPEEGDPLNPSYTVTMNVGPNEVYRKIDDAIAQLIKMYDTDGKGNKVKIILKKDYIFSGFNVRDGNNLQWITIAPENPNDSFKVLDSFNSASFGSNRFDYLIYIGKNSKSPILNFSLIIDSYTPNPLSTALSIFLIDGGSDLTIRGSNIRVKQLSNLNHLRLSFNRYDSNNIELTDFTYTNENKIQISSVYFSCSTISISNCNFQDANLNLIASERIIIDSLSISNSNIISTKLAALSISSPRVSIDGIKCTTSTNMYAMYLSSASKARISGESSFISNVSTYAGAISIPDCRAIVLLEDSTLILQDGVTVNYVNNMKGISIGIKSNLILKNKVSVLRNDSKDGLESDFLIGSDSNLLLDASCKGGSEAQRKILNAEDYETWFGQEFIW